MKRYKNNFWKAGVRLILAGSFVFQVQAKKIVIIAGPLDDHPVGTHEYENTALLLKHCLEASSSFAGIKTEVHFNGWPENPATLDDADTILLTSGGSDRKETDHPLYLDDRFAQLEKQIQRGCGLVLLHWSTFHPSRVGEQLTEWMGGYFDYEKGTGGPTKRWFSKIENRDWRATPTDVSHPIGRGLKPFDLTEEFYFNIRFRPNDTRLTPILVKDVSGKTLENTVAWAVERAEGGRGFGFTGGHYFTNWWKPEFRKIVLNAIAWTAKVEVAEDGIISSLDTFQPLPSKKIKPTNGATKPATVKKVLPANIEKDSGKVAREEQWKDSRWSQMDVGQFLGSTLPTSNGIIAKGLSIKLGKNAEAAVCYDTALANLRVAWTGNFLEFDPARFGLINSPKIGGAVQFLAPAKVGWGDVKPAHRGLFLSGKRVVLSYGLGDASVLESPWFEENVFTRTFNISARKQSQKLSLVETKGAHAAITNVNGTQIGLVEKEGKFLAIAVVGSGKPELIIEHDSIILEFPQSSEPLACKLLMGQMARDHLDQFVALANKDLEPENLQELANDSQIRWTGNIITKGQVAFSTDPYVVDTITVPYENPHKALLYLSGLDFFKNGDAAVCSIHGDVWIVSGIDEKLQKISWKRFATGLFQPLGLKIVDDKVYVIGRDQITILHDRNRDGEADFYENFFNQIETSVGGHDYVTCLERDAVGNFYFVDPSGLHRVSKDGKEYKTIATGWRNPNGMSVGPNDIITVTPQEGNWTPSSAIFEIRPEGYYGFGGPKITTQRPEGYDAPLCWIPRMIDNSTASQVWVTSDKWGALKGQMLSLSFGRCAMMLVLRETVEGQSQGGVVPLKPRFLSGAMRGEFREQDGQLYVVGSLGWSTSATREGSFQRVRYTGKDIFLPTALNVFQNGIRVTFSELLDRETAEDIGSYGIEQWNYRYAKEYGSKEYSVRFPNEVGHDAVEIKSAHLSHDGRSVFLEIPDVQPVMQMRIRYNVNAANGKAIQGEVYNTINRLGTSSERNVDP